MAKRMTKAESELIMWAVIIGLPIYGVTQLGESMGWGVLIGVIAAVIALVFWYKGAQTKKRREMLMEKYQDSDLVNNLMECSFWQGQTSGQLLDSLGSPDEVDEKILKTKKKEVWKYNHQSGNRYGLRITLDNDIVVGWDQKT
jgi:hypothetical protein